jgi:hypothetical protein
MTSADDEATLLSVAEEIAESVQRHALVASYASDDPGVLAVETAKIRVLLEKYRGLLGDDNGGVRDPFGPRCNSSEAVTGSGSRGTVKNEIELSVSYRALVVDTPKAIELAHDRARRKGDKSACVSPDSGDSDLVSALFMIDGWDLGEYDQSVVRFIDESWECRYVKR